MIDTTTLWADKYAEEFARLREQEEQFRDEAFCELPRTVAGEPVRLMTTRDLHLLDGVRNAFVCGSAVDAESLAGHVGVFVWQLHAARMRGRWIAEAWQFGRMMSRLRRRKTKYLAAVQSVRDYMDFIFFDAPRMSGAEGRPFGGSFIVPLLGTLAAEFGGADPMSGRAWGDVPLPQVFHWQKLAAKLALGRLGKDYIDRNRSDRVLSDFADEVNRSADRGN